MLAGLMNYFQPSIIRTLDPQPYRRDDTCTPSHTCASMPSVSCSSNASCGAIADNVDHAYVARFVDEALPSYTGNGRLQLYNYKGYSLWGHEGNLFSTGYGLKAAASNAYGAFDAWWDANAYIAMFGATHERFPQSTTWLTRRSTGLLAAFAVLDRRPVAWLEYEQRLIRRWQGPIPIPDPLQPLAPHLSAVNLPDGRLALIALTLPRGQNRDTATPTSPRQSVIFNVLDTSGAWSGWTSLGNPDDDPPGAAQCIWHPPSSPFTIPLSDCRWLGAPIAVVNAQGLLEVFVRNSFGRMSAIRQTGPTTFTPWQSLPDLNNEAYDVLDSPATILDNAGKVHLFASTIEGAILHWQETTVGSFQAVSFPLPPPSAVADAASPPTVTKNQDGRLEVFWHRAGSQGVYTSYVQTNGQWSIAGSLGSAQGAGPIAAVQRSTGHIMLFEKNQNSGISANWQATINSAFNASWLDLAGLAPGLPSATNDINGRVVMAVVGIDGNLWLRRETSATIGSFGNWTTVGQ